jgi:hypothetical protein
MTRMEPGNAMRPLKRDPKQDLAPCRQFWYCD